MFEFPTLGQVVQLLFLIALIYWTIKTSHDESEKRKIRHKEEKALIEDMTVLTTTRVKFASGIDSNSGKKVLTTKLRTRNLYNPCI
jgi:hypothetical protein